METANINPSRGLGQGDGFDNAGEDKIKVLSTEEIDDNMTDDKITEEGEVKRISNFSEDYERELYLLDDQKEEFRDKLLNIGIDVPEDDYGRPFFTRPFVKSLPKKIAREIMHTVYENDDMERRSMSTEGSSYESEGEMSRKSQFTDDRRSISTSAPDTLLGVQYTPSGLGFIVDPNGHKLTYEAISRYLENAFTEQDLQKQAERSHEKDATLLSIIRKERREEEKNLDKLKKVDSLIELKEMALRYVPETNLRPTKQDPLTVFEHARPQFKDNSFAQKTQKGVDFVNLLDPRDFAIGRVDSFATVPSTIERKFSNASVRGSMISTHLSDLPSMYSQALVDEPSAAVMASNDQVFDISPASGAAFRQTWLSNYMQGFTPKNTFVVSIINLINKKTVELRVNKENTLNEICHIYMQYEDHPEYYVWKDVYGRVLQPKKTLVENGMMGQDEKMEFQGYRKQPVILLHFRDGFEDDPPMPLNPIFASKQKEAVVCRNY